MLVKNLQRIAQYQNKNVGELLAAPGVKNITCEAESECKLWIKLWKGCGNMWISWYLVKIIKKR